MLITLKHSIIDYIIVDKVINNVLDVIVRIRVMIVSENKTITIKVLSLLLAIKSDYLEKLS